MDKTRCEKTNNPLVSVIVPVYNVAPYIRESLNSVIRQTYKNLEILIIDDGSTDVSGSICDEYAIDIRVRVIHQDHMGPSQARNAGIEASTGDYIAFLDSDDVLHPEFVQRMLTAMIKYAPDVVVCKNDRQSGAGEGNQILDRKKALIELVCGQISWNVWSKLFTKKSLENIRFPLETSRGEDMVFILRVFDLCSTVIELDEILYRYRERPGSLTYTWTIDAFNEAAWSQQFLNTFIWEHIPEVYSSKDLLERQQKWLRYMISWYVKASPPSEEIRKRIISFTDEVGIGNFEFKTRMAYHMLRYAPWLLKVAYLIYYPVRMTIWKTVGR